MQLDPALGLQFRNREQADTPQYAHRIAWLLVAALHIAVLLALNNPSEIRSADQSENAISVEFIQDKILEHELAPKVPSEPPAQSLFPEQVSARVANSAETSNESKQDRKLDLFAADGSFKQDIWRKAPKTEVGKANVFNTPAAVTYKPTRFAHVYKPDGNVLDVALWKYPVLGLLIPNPKPCVLIDKAQQTFDCDGNTSTRKAVVENW